MTSNRERVLLALFLTALFAAAGALGGNAALRHLREQKRVLQEKEAQLEEARQWLEEMPTWETRGRWLMEHPPLRYEGPQTEAAFVQEIQDSLARQKVEILEQHLQESEPGRKVVEVGIDLVLSGSLEQIVRWLREIRKAESYCVIRQIQLKSGAQETTMRVDISLGRFYGKG